MITLAPEVLDRYTGEYRDDQNRRFIIRREDSRMYAQIFSRPNLELLVHSKQEFGMRWTAGRLAFDLNSDGEPVGVKLLVGRAEFSAKKIK